MSQLSTIFDILRGWPDGSALSWDFVQDSGAASDIEEGSVVSIVAGSSPTSVDRHTSALIGPNSDQLDHPWLVIRGKESSESQFTGKLTCLKLRTGIIFKVPTSETPQVGDLLWANNGELTKVDPGGNVPHIGKVLEYNSTENWMTVES